MKAYRGRIQITCTRTKGGCLRNLRENVQAGCMDCPEALTQVLDLEDKVVFEYRSPEIRTGERPEKAKKPAKQK